MVFSFFYLKRNNFNISISFTGNGYLIALICILLIIMFSAAIGGFYYWHQVLRQRHINSNANGTTATCHRHHHHDDEKSNNLQNEENLRRYANPLKEDSGKAAGSVGGDGGLDLPPRVSVVRPLTSVTLPPDGTAEALELIPDGAGGTGNPTAGGKCLTSEHQPRSTMHHRNSQILLYKAQNSDIRKNTAAAFDDAGAHKDFAKRIINLKVLPPVQRTLHPDRTGGGDVLTVIV